MRRTDGTGEAEKTLLVSTLVTLVLGAWVVLFVAALTVAIIIRGTEDGR